MEDNIQNYNTFHIVIFGNEGSIHVRRWVLGLRELGNRVDLITFCKDSKHDIGGISLNANWKSDYIFKIRKLRGIVRRLQPDIFHSHYASSFGFLASFIDHPRKILSVWGDDIVIFPTRNLISKKIIQKSLCSAKHITATSEYLKKVTYNFKADISGITVIPFGVDPNKFQFFERENKTEIKIGMTKHLAEIYGVDILIRAFSEIARGNNIRLIIAGRGTKEREYKQQSTKLGLDQIIEFAGEIDHSQMPQFLNSIDIMAMPSRSDAESFGVSALEGSATGLPVVATRVGGIPEVVIHGVTGFLAENENISEIATYLEKLVRNPELRKKMGIAGRKMVEQKYRWEDNLCMMQTLYNEMMAS